MLIVALAFAQQTKKPPTFERRFQANYPLYFIFCSRRQVTFFFVQN